MALYRGAYRLAHMSQVLGRDEKATEIGRHPDGRASGYMLTDEQHRERVTTGRGGLPYRFLVRSPESTALAWTAFFDREDLQAFVDAYGLALSCEPSPGESFEVVLPSTAAGFRPLVDEKRVRYARHMYGLRNMGFLEVDAESVQEARELASAYLERTNDELVGALLPEAPVDLGAGLFRVRLR